jgi:uncharacterized protein YuzE
MELHYDPEANMGYLYLRKPGQKGVVKYSVPRCHVSDDNVVRCELLIDFDEEGHFIGVEIYSPKENLIPEELAKAKQPPWRNE